MRSVLFGACAAIVLLGPAAGFAEDHEHGDSHGGRGAPAAEAQRGPPPGGRGGPDHAVQRPQQGPPPGLQQAPPQYGRGAAAGAGRPAPQGYQAQAPQAPGAGRGGYQGQAQRPPSQYGGYAQPGDRGYGAPNGQGRGYGDDRRLDGGHGDPGRFADGDRGRGFRDGGQAFAYGGRQYFRYRVAPYRFPDGYGSWAGHAWRRGEWLPPIFISSAYFINDWYDYGLWEPEYGFQWIRVGPDAVLIDLADGHVVDVVPGVYYS